MYCQDLLSFQYGFNGCGILIISASTGMYFTHTLAHRGYLCQCFDNLTAAQLLANILILTETRAQTKHTRLHL